MDMKRRTEKLVDFHAPENQDGLVIKFILQDYQLILLKFQTLSKQENEKN